MTDYSTGFQGLSSRAQEFITQKIDDGDGKINASERDKIAEYLNGKQQLPAEYGGVREELEQFGRDFDVQAARAQLTEDEALSVEFRGMSDRDRHEIDTITDYNTMKAIAEGTLEGYTPLQQAYARALLGNSLYAQAQMLRAENTDLIAQNQALMAENENLKSELAKLYSKSDSAKQEQQVTQEAISALDSLEGETWDVLKDKLNGPVSKIISANATIVDTCKQIENFENSGANPTTIENAVRTAINTIEQKQEEIVQAKQEGNQILQESEPDTTQIADATVKAQANAGLNALMQLFGNVSANAIKVSVGFIEEQ